MNKFEQLIRSRKFWAAFVAVAIAVFGARAGVSEGELILAVGTLVTYILGTALEDGLKG
jgi:hypothetical protein